MPQSMHALQFRQLALAVVNVALFDVCFLGGNQ
jgi:hypothetical protein